MYNLYTFNYKDVIGDADTDVDSNDNGDENCKGIFFADDSLLILSGDCPDKLLKRGNHELEKTRLYMNANKLLINGKKTQFLLYKPKGKTKVQINEKLKIDDLEIEQVNHARYLGVIFDDKLNFEEQFNRIKSKLKDGVKALMCTC